MSSPIAHWPILTTDPHGIWKVSTVNDLGYRELSTRENQAADGGIRRAPPGSQEIVQRFIEADDIDAKLHEIEKAGGKTLFACHEIPEGDVMALAIDPKVCPIGRMSRAAGTR